MNEKLIRYEILNGIEGNSFLYYERMIDNVCNSNMHGE